jgi:hypothetical protein
MHPIAGNVAWKRRSAAWRRQRGFGVFGWILDDRVGAGAPSVRSIPPHSGGRPQRAKTTWAVFAPCVFWHSLCL